MLDVAIRGGDIVDGTGAPRLRADLGIAGGRVVAVADVGPAREELGAAGLIVAPGFVDVHTHYDAQVCWDPDVSPSALHGVTTVLAGNCGFSLAPADPADDYLLRMLAVVEGIPLEALLAGVTIGWTSFAEYIGQVERDVAVNIGFLAGHSTIRRAVLGADAASRPATPEERAAMVAALHDCLGAGALGFSSSRGPLHFDGDGAPVPSRAADDEELLALARACRDHAGTSVELLPPHLQASNAELLTAVAAAAGRPLNWNALRISASNAEEVAAALTAGAVAAERGSRVVGLTMPIPSRARFSFRHAFALDGLPEWGPVVTLPLAERMRALADPGVRDRMRRGAASTTGLLREIANVGDRVIIETFGPATDEFRGRVVADIAAEQGKDPLDALLDIALADELETKFMRRPAEPSRDDWLAMVDAWREERVVIGASDAGAHVDFTAYFDYPVYVLEKAVRDHGALALEEAVHHLTDVPARLYGLRDRGRLVAGAAADVVVFDERTIATGPIETRFDLPAGAGRLYAEPTGIAAVLVNGERIVEGGTATGRRPGRVLRSGRDTVNPT